MRKQTKGQKSPASGFFLLAQNEMKIALSAGIGISVLIIQALISYTGTIDSNLYICIISFSISIPLFSLILFIISTREVRGVFRSVILYIILFVAGAFFYSGLYAAFGHLSPIAGTIFTILTIISAAIYTIYYFATEDQEIDFD